MLYLRAFDNTIHQESNPYYYGYNLYDNETKCNCGIDENMMNYIIKHNSLIIDNYEFDKLKNGRYVVTKIR